MLGGTEPEATKLSQKLSLLPLAGQFLVGTPSGIISQFSCLPTDPISLCFEPFLTSFPQHRWSCEFAQLDFGGDAEFHHVSRK